MTWSSIRFILLPSPLVDHHKEQGRENWSYCSSLGYKMLKFTDARDERFDHIVDYDRPYQGQERTTFHVKQNVNWCKPGNVDGKHGRTVIYVPGHEGTYMQARSLGAHGTTLTRHGKDIPRRELNDLLRRLMDGSMSASASNVNDFLFDVYAVDFGGEGGGIHGSRLFAQSTFVVSALERIADECRNDEDRDMENHVENEIIIVAHSIGGLVARRAALLVNQKRQKDGKLPLVKSVITLATPHGGIPFIFDSSVYRFQWDMEKMQEWLYLLNTTAVYNLPVISISGGLRDELIPPSSCRIDGKNTISVLATNIVNSPDNRDYSFTNFGMDHNAIVWCHGVLSFVREVIHAAEYEKILKLIQGKQQRGIVKGHGNTTCNFDCQNMEKQKLLQLEYGLLPSFAIMTSMLYNSQLSLVLYVINGILNCLFLFWCRYFETTKKDLLSFSYFVIPILSSIVASVTVVGKSYIGFGSICILSFNAMNIYYCIFYGIFSCWWAPNGDSNRHQGFRTASVTHPIQSQTFHAIKLIIASFVVLLLGFVVFRDVVVINGLSLGSMVFLAHVATTMFYIVRVGMATRNDPKSEGITRSIATTLFILFPILSFGKIIFALSLLTGQGQTKAIPYMNFERFQLERFCNARICKALSVFEYDLSRYATLICFPIYFFSVKRIHQLRTSENHDVYTKND
jgi:pimeloyl-ACP methyl ester carboxylesterase